MSLDAVVWWFFAAAWLIVVGLIVFVALPRILRAAMTLVRHILVIGEAGSLQSQISMAEKNSLRINRALDRLPALAVRAQSALTTIRTTPVVPPRLARLAGAVRDEYRAFRRSLD
jgi:hypothetical protein